MLGGFEVVIKAGDFETLCRALGNRATAIVGDEYNTCETQLVENAVNVYDTGIFNSSSFKYDGTGMVVAVLDTGLDYNHTAFSVNNFTADRSKLGMTFSDVEAMISDTKANKLHSDESNPYDNEQIKEDFNELYRLMNGMELREMDRIIYPVCRLCRDHERSGFIEGIKIGVLLQAELTEE